jgi:selenocysteine lyase/cysteine desulfurase
MSASPTRQKVVMTLHEVRKEFPALQQQTFLDSACVSLAPQRAVEKLREFLHLGITNVGQHAKATV